MKVFLYYLCFLTIMMACTIISICHNFVLQSIAFMVTTAFVGIATGVALMKVDDNTNNKAN